MRINNIMDFNIENNTYIEDDTSQKLDIAISQPVIEILTYDKKLMNFLTLSNIELPDSYIEKITNFSFKNKWISFNSDDVSVNGEFLLTYTCMDVDVKLQANYTHINKKSKKIRDIVLEGTFDDIVKCDWDVFKCDACINETHSLWFIKILYWSYSTIWCELMMI